MSSISRPANYKTGIAAADADDPVAPQPLRAVVATEPWPLTLTQAALLLEATDGDPCPATRQISY
jgi:hypothetical protein